MEVPVNFSPRDYQREFLVKIRDKRLAVLEWARRAGKDLTCFVYAIKRMIEEPIGVVIIFPTAEQGYRSFWNNIENDGFRTLDHIPKELIASKNSTKDNMSITLKNGSTLELVGSNANPDKLRGNNIRLFILSEFVDITPGVLGIIRPVTTANKGQIIINSTPKQDGVSGSTFLKLYAHAAKDPTQYASKVYGHQYLTEEELELARRDCIAENGNDFLFRQEYLLDEGQALATSYYGNILAIKKKNSEIGDHPYNKKYPVYTSWDLGKADSTAGWFWQYYDGALHIIDAYETHDTADALLVGYIKSKPYNYAWHFFPHDGARRDSDDIQRIIKLQQLGLPNSSLLRRRDKESGIHDAQELLRKSSTTLHEPFLSVYIDKLKIYKRKWNKLTGDYEGPDHTSESDIADGIRYVSDSIQQYFRDGQFIMQRNNKRTEETEEDWSSGVNWYNF